LKRTAINEIADTNLQSRKYNLRLSETEAVEILQSRNKALVNYGRVELNLAVINKLITMFCNSPYLNQDNYAATICELVDLFYYMKNETRDEIPDDELIDFLKDRFDNHCFGSLELLMGRDLEKLLNNIRHGRYNIWVDDENDEGEV
jgi:hypothetical protein